MFRVADTLKEYMEDANLATSSNVSEEDEEKYTHQVETQLVSLRSEVEALRSRVEHKRRETGRSISLHSQKHYLRSEVDKVPEIATSSVFRHLMAIAELEGVVDNLRQAMESTEKEEFHLRTMRDHEMGLRDSLLEFKSELQIDLETLKNHKDLENISLLVEGNRGRIQSSKQLNRVLLSELRFVLDTVVSHYVKISSQSALHPISPLDEISPRLRETIEVLLNAMFESDGKYTYLDLNDPITQFLINGDLVTIDQQNTRMFRLREFGKM
jgi:hypothetical protein